MRKLRVCSPLVFLSLCLAAPSRAQGQDAPRVEVGVQYSTLSLDAVDSFGTETIPSFGARFTYNFNDHLAAEAEGNFAVTHTRRTYAQGGRYEQLQAGVKAGKRWERFGLFGKARPGFLSFDDTLRPAFTRQPLPDGTFFDFPTFESQRKTHFTADVGGVLEFYPSRRLVVRFDAGDTIIRYGARDIFGPPVVVVPSPGGPVHTPSIIKAPAEFGHNFQFSAGVGFRF